MVRLVGILARGAGADELVGASWTRVDPTPINTSGFWNDPYSEILRPRNLAAADLFGNTLPEIIAGFGPSSDGGSLGKLRFAVWANSCVGDANLDGKTDEADLALLLAAFGSCAGDPQFNPDADFNKDGCIDRVDLAACLADFGCNSSTDRRLGLHHAGAR